MWNEIGLGYVYEQLAVKFLVPYFNIPSEFKIFTVKHLVLFAASYSPN